MIIARQSTARTVTIGPILNASGVAVTDGVVGDLKLSKNGEAPAALNGSATLTHRHTGHYSLALTASDLDTVGQVEIVIDDTTNACPQKEITVLEEAVYDALFVAAAPGYVANAPVNMAQINGTSIAGTGTRVADSFVAFLNIASPTLTVASTNQTGDSFARLGAPVGASISADIVTIGAYLDTEIAAIKAKTDQLTFTVATRLDVNTILIEGGDATNALAAAGGGASAEDIAIEVFSWLVVRDITPSAAITDDDENQSTGVNFHQAFNQMFTRMCGPNSGARTNNPTYTEPGTGVYRLEATTSIDGRAAVIMVLATMPS